MTALGLIGLVAALIGKLLSGLKSPASRFRLPILCFYGLISGIFYSFFLDTWTMLWTYGTINGEGYLAALAAAVPYTILYSVSNAVFILLLDPPFGKRLGRIITKYRI
jgi:energy-coupling factor transport system substrate-specific component